MDGIKVFALERVPKTIKNLKENWNKKIIDYYVSTNLTGLFIILLLKTHDTNIQSN